MRPILAVLTVVVSLVCATAAQADTVAYRGTSLAYDGDSGADQVVVSRDGASARVQRRDGPGARGPGGLHAPQRVGDGAAPHAASPTWRST